MTNFVCALPLRDAAELLAYGGKAVSLGVGLRAGLPVPDGAALSAAWVARFVEHGEGLDELTRLGMSVGYPLAARSSAVGEDGASASFAGRYESVLNVVDTAGLARALATVYRSGSGASVAAYRRRVGAGASEAAGVGVVLQRMAMPRAAGVMFSFDPVSGEADVVIEASWGLGESVVGGLVVPDRYRVQRCGEEPGVVEQTLGVKDVRVEAVAGGGTREVVITAHDAHRPCLTDEDVRALFRMLLHCERVYGGGRDVEWCFVGASLHLLQCRPITGRRAMTPATEQREGAV